MKVWLSVVVTLCLCACAEFQPAVDTAPRLGPPLQSLTVEGRISVRQGERRDHLRFRWQHGPDSDVVLFMSPLGQGLAELVRDAAGARLTQPNQAPIVADTLPQLVQRVLGAQVPLEAIVDWLRGARPEPGGDVAGWRVEVGETSVFHQHRLPRVMEARRDDIEVKLVVDDRELPP